MSRLPSAFNILYLGPKSTVFDFLCETNNVTQTEEKLSELNQYDFVVSYKYRHIVKPNVIKFYKGKIINLHISYLPFNRGADPNLWSILHDTKKGVTIHHMDEGLDTGNIIKQREIQFAEHDTLGTSYEKLTIEMHLLFVEVYNDFCVKRQFPKGIVQNKELATVNRSKDKVFFFKHFPDGWDTPIKDAKYLYNKIIGGC